MFPTSLKYYKFLVTIQNFMKVKKKNRHKKNTTTVSGMKIEKYEKRKIK